MENTSNKLFLGTSPAFQSSCSLFWASPALPLRCSPLLPPQAAAWLPPAPYASAPSVGQTETEQRDKREAERSHTLGRTAEGTQGQCQQQDRGSSNPAATLGLQKEELG